MPRKENVRSAQKRTDVKDAVLGLPEDVAAIRAEIRKFFQRKHPDVRIARRATTIANLARVISERNVSKGLRRTLLTQARRLEKLAAERIRELGMNTG